ncbi:hypothetical protein TVAG_359450 [Trichomonas vaginalis G3]|uniref:Uncharacterized protein n=1 Tax=Trichomonas vaginalis (strain ATCC PRA-98 / G3) TaxID=412133 RepID=A2DT64_TRIV3|nr:hypothetical protein TVAGG3_0968760 [Trichomonas vaginalis G3]EAY16336.1 hypothetical protein TVAG_359450 [Trichomonas vaginalis G3]KAI5488438.1 hypothetical protein TVAGG3_0968760 [Trichomonas vaginalis G3]|eukprot:XP_001328559.1 hypothetical protein [Trichomonas vaginalis G3]
MSESGKIRRRVKKVTQDGEVQKVHIRVKKPRALDENGNYLPHKHHHTNTITDTFTEVSMIPYQTNDLTAINTQTVTDDYNYNNKKNSVEIKLPHQNSTDTKSERSTRSHKKYSAKALQVFEELEPGWVETRITQKRFLKHDSDDEFAVFTQEPESTIVDTVHSTQTLSQTQELMVTTNTIDFGDVMDDPFFNEIQQGILAEREARIQAKIRAKEGTFTDDSVASITKTMDIEEDIPHYRLYPKSTCPEKYRLESEYSIISEPPYRSQSDMTEVEILVEANPETADYIEADSNEERVEIFVEQTASTSDVVQINPQLRESLSNAQSDDRQDSDELHSFSGYETGEEEEYYYSESEN